MKKSNDELVFKIKTMIEFLRAFLVFFFRLLRDFLVSSNHSTTKVLTINR